MKRTGKIAAVTLGALLALNSWAFAAGRTVDAGRGDGIAAPGCAVTNVVKVETRKEKNQPPNHPAAAQLKGAGYWDAAEYTAVAPAVITLAAGTSFYGFSQSGDPLSYDSGTDTGSDRSAITLAEPGDYLICVTGKDLAETRFVLTVVPEETEITYYDTHVVERSSAAVLLNGKAITPATYTLYQPSGDGTNYVQLRDLARQMAGTGGQFDVDWDDATATVLLTAGKAYSGGAVPPGDESPLRYATRSAARVTVDGQERSFLCYAIGGNHYFSLRALGEALGVSVD
ncbi:MAG: hypothetical protein RSC08_06560, partial [Oscillospiraceae bacterium]